jgi:glycosyltransferase involved in cell wall biosynthesis
VRGQTRPPDLWLIADDGSTDDTLAVAREIQRSTPFLRVLSVPPSSAAGAEDRLAVALEARAFNWALRQVEWREYEFVGKLDADIVPPAQMYERLLEEFARDRDLWLAGAYIEEDHGAGWEVNDQPGYHVNGGVRLYRRECLELFDGLPERLSWDTIDATYARMKGHHTRSFPDLKARHLRRSGAAAGFVRGKVRHGECVWLVAYPPSLVLARAARMAATGPGPVAAAAFVWGYVRAAVLRRGRIDDRELLRFARDEQVRRVRGALRQALAGRS